MAKGKIQEKEVIETDQDWRDWQKTINEESEVEMPKTINRDELNLNHFFNDMSLIGKQVNSGGLKKPTFNYGDLSVTNYLLWLMLAELMMLNNKAGEKL